MFEARKLKDESLQLQGWKPLFEHKLYGYNWYNRHVSCIDSS